MYIQEVYTSLLSGNDLFQSPVFCPPVSLSSLSMSVSSQTDIIDMHTLQIKAY